jgi:hypothetical protein
MKSCLGSLLLLLSMAALLATGGLVWYLSGTARFSKKEAQPAAEVPAPAPKAPATTR